MGLFAVLLTTLPRAEATVIANSPDFPPATGEYTTAGQEFVTFTNPGGGILEVDLLDSAFGQFSNTVITPLPGGDELEEFEAAMTGSNRQVLPFGGSTLTVNTDIVSLSGPVQVVTSGRTGNPTGTFSSEIISMELGNNLGGFLGGFDIRLRESPTLASIGQVTITDIGGGEFQIESFYELFTEMSVDNGPWVPADSSSIINLVPEPSTTVMSLLGLLALVARRRRG